MRVLLVLLLLVPAMSGCMEGVFGERLVGPYDYIRDGEYSTWVIQFDHVEGHPPSEAAVATLLARLDGLVRKDSIQARVSPDPIDESRGTWSEADILGAHAGTQARTGGGTVVTHVLLLDGHYEEPGRLGVTYRYDVVALFPDAIAEACTVEWRCLFDHEEVMAAVLVHQVGHALGLVNRGLPMVRPHADPDHPRHSANEASVMHWAVQDAEGLLGLGRLPTDFDADDHRDICAAGGCPRPPAG